MEVRTNKWFEYGGIKMIASDWARKWGVGRFMIQTHIKRGKTFQEVYNFYENKKRT